MPVPKIVSVAIPLTFLIFTGINSCKSPIEPCTDCPQQPDTTSQNFTFETFEFGDGFSSSYLNDVWIFDENNIWAVGWIQQNEFQGNCNIIRWNGTKWNYVNSGSVSSSSGIYGMWALDSSTIYFGSGAIRRYKDGQFRYENTSEISFTPGQSVTKLWGSSASNIWGVGPWGTVVHYDGLSWKKVEFDSSWYFYNVTGNPKTGEAYALASKAGSNGLIVKLPIESEPEIIIQTSNGLIGPDDDLKLLNNNQLIFGDNLIQILDIKSKSYSSFKDANFNVSIASMFVYSETDIYFWGFRNSDGLHLVHYNGNKFKEYNFDHPYIGYPWGIFAIKDFAVAVSFNLNKGLIVKIKRKI